VFPNSAGAALTLIGLVITVVLYARKITGALVISIVLTTIIGVIMGVQSIPDSLTATPDFSTLGQFDLGEVFTVLGTLTALLTIFSFMLTDFFDTMGTATAIVEQADLTDEEGRIPDVGKLLLVDSIGAALGGAAGVSSNTSYIESSAGVAEGGRTGLTAVVVGVLFLLSIFLAPIAGIIPPQATAPVLILVGFLMCSLIKDIDFTDFEEGLPALLAIILMPLTYSITVGIGAGFVMWVLIKAVKGKAAEVPLLMWVVAVAFVIYFSQTLLGQSFAA
jgi:AGZA family xanthine/uracil permease-like MFS transporter